MVVIKENIVDIYDGPLFVKKDNKIVGMIFEIDHEYYFCDKLNIEYAMSDPDFDCLIYRLTKEKNYTIEISNSND